MHELRLDLTRGVDSPLIFGYQVDGFRRITFGRRGDPDLRGALPRDSELSREHFEIEVIDGEATLYDLGGKNGTRVNGQAVVNGRTLERGDRIQAGTLTLVFELIERASDTPPASASGPATVSSRAELEISPEIHARNLATLRRATIRASGVPCALKELAIDVSQLRQRTLAFFRREARIALRLRHPSIVRVLGAGEDAQHIWLLMEWIEGPNLEELTCDIRGRGLGTVETLRIADQLLAALVYTHAKGVIHRDVKPANVMTRETAVGLQAMLTDFGIASATWDVRLTVTDEGKGSYPFMPPEQSRNARQAGVAADIYGLAATLYFALSGGQSHLGTPTLPGEEPSPPLPIARFRPDIPASLAAVLDRCLSPDPAARPQSAHALRALLAQERLALPPETP